MSTDDLMEMRYPDKEHSNGTKANYYDLPSEAEILQDLISHKNMNAQIGTIFSSCYRYDEVAHSDMLREIRKIKFYADAEEKRLLALRKGVNLEGWDTSKVKSIADLEEYDWGMSPRITPKDKDNFIKAIAKALRLDNETK